MWYRTIIALLLTVGISQSTFAQAATEERVPKDPKAKAVLDKLSAKNKAYTSISADFESRLSNAEGLNETQKGSILIKGNRYILDIAGQRIINNGKMVITVVENEATLNDLPGEDEENFIDPAKIFSIYEEGFKYVYDGEKTEGGTTVQVIKLFPIKPAQQKFHTIKLSVDKAKTEIRTMVIKSKDGNDYTYKVTRFTPNAPAPDKDFDPDLSTFDDIIDLRENAEY